MIVIAVEPRTLADPEWVTLELEAGRETVRDFALADGIRIHGVVTDAARILGLSRSAFYRRVKKFNIDLP